MKITFLKHVDNYLGRFVCGMLRPQLSRQLIEPRTILLIRPGGIGDAVLLIPSINSLIAAYPKVKITILAEKRNVGVFALVPGIENVLCYDRPHEFIRTLRDKYDIVIDAEQWHRLSAVVARLVRAPFKIGFDTNERRRMFTRLIPYSHDDYEVSSFMNLLEPLWIDEDVLDQKTPFLTLPMSASEKAIILLKPLNDKPFVVIFPSASIAERRWGVERFSFVAKRLAGAGYRIVVVGGREDRSEGEFVVGADGLNLAGMTTLAETAAVIERSSLVISGDSGVLHIAVGLDIPTVSLFGPGIAAKWAPRGDKHIVLNLRLTCSPCTRFGTTSPCPDGVRCMNEITADQVVEAAVRLLHA